MTSSRTLLGRSPAMLLAVISLATLAPACLSEANDSTSDLNQALNQGNGNGAPGSHKGGGASDRDGGAGGSASGGTCDATGDCAACQDCAVNGACSAPIQACVASPDCSGFLACLEPCQDDACANACLAQFPGAEQPYMDAAECVFGACPASCGGSVPPGGPGNPPPGSACDTGDCGSCQGCAVNGACSAQFQACVASPDCSGFLDCLQTCQDDACANACLAQFPGAEQPYMDAAECVFGACPATCGGSAPPGGPGNPPPSGTCDAAADCVACQGCAMRDACSAQIQACLDSADCQSLLDCLQPCQDQACADGCVNQFPGAEQIYSDAATCVFCDCQTSCGVPAGACGI